MKKLKKPGYRNAGGTDSSFCNAGITIFSDTGMYDYTLHPLMNLTTASLMIVSGARTTLTLSKIQAKKSASDKKH